MNTSADDTKSHAIYTVVLRCAESQIRIATGGGILVSPIASDYGNSELRITTRSDAVAGVHSPIPRKLWIEVRGPAPTLEIAINIASAIANEYGRQIAFVSNAWQRLLDAHLAYDNLPGSRRRIFFQNWVNDERGGTVT